MTRYQAVRAALWGAQPADPKRGPGVRDMAIASGMSSGAAHTGRRLS